MASMIIRVLMQHPIQPFWVQYALASGYSGLVNTLTPMQSGGILGHDLDTGTLLVDFYQAEDAGIGRRATPLVSQGHQCIPGVGVHP